MAQERTLEELAEIADKLVLEVPCMGACITPQLEAQLHEIVGNLTKEDWKRLWVVFMIRHFPQRVAKFLGKL